jgi:NAD(P)-dependent dehydrogenase (short-subunit alcohol dehydrogenase family)
MRQTLAFVNQSFGREETMELAADVFDLTGRVVWVTGSSRGIGAGIAAHLARHGAAVVVHGRKPGSTDETVAHLGGDAMAVHADVRDPDAIAAAVAEIEERHGRLDGVVANVGGAGFGSLDDTDPARFARQLDLNLVAAFSTLRAAHRLLDAAGGAAVLISATAATNPTPMFAAYGAAKAGIEHLARSMAAEWGPRVRVNAVAPGLIRTEGSMAAVFQGSAELAARAGRTTAVGRVGEPEDVAWACHFLLSPAAGFVSGATLVVDGGPTEGPTQRILRALEQP